nr:Gag-Pol polyprotein [Tanacetum cinerariifolium]
VFNKRTRVIMESIHVNFDELPQMASAHNSSDPAHTCQRMASVQISSDPAPECQTMALEHGSLSPGRKCQENVSQGDKTGTTSNELDLLFSPMFDELLNGSTKVVSKSFVVFAADAPNECQQPTTPLNNHTTPAPTCQTPPITPSVISYENINQAEPHAKNDEVADDVFINIFSTPVQDQGETSTRHVDSSNMHTFYQRYPFEQRWTKDHPSEQTMVLKHDNLSPGRKCHENVSHGDKTGTTLNELDLLFSPMFDELLNGSSKVVCKSSAVSATDAPNERQQLKTPLNNHTTPAPTWETSSRHVDSSNMHTFYQRYPSEYRWTKDHPLEQVIGNPSQSIRTRRQIESDAEMCMFALTMSRTEPKNINEAMSDSAWIESMQEELHQFDRLDVWELVDRPLCINVINWKCL